jgi:hypothetical protein
MAPWTDDETLKLQMFYNEGNTTPKSLAAFFPEKTEQAIAGKIQALKKKKIIKTKKGTPLPPSSTPISSTVKLGGNFQI